MRFRFSYPLLIVAFCLVSAWGQRISQQSPLRSSGDPSNSTPPTTKVPTGVILVKGAWSSSSDSVTPVPEGGNVAGNVFSDEYFGMTHTLPPDWTEKYQGPPPSDSGRYVLAQLSPADTFKGPVRGSILITAQDMFFTRVPAGNTTELINYMKDNLQADYKVEMAPRQTRIADRSFTLFAYWSPVAQFHWYALATQIRCHTVQIVLTSRDSKLLERLILDMNRMRLPEEASPSGGGGGALSPFASRTTFATKT
jgi:hypothetical protein